MGSVCSLLASLRCRACDRSSRKRDARLMSWVRPNVSARVGPLLFDAGQAMPSPIQHFSLLAAAVLAAGCTHISPTKGTTTSGAPTSLSTVAVEYVTPRFVAQNIAAKAALAEWSQITAVARDVTPRVFARAQIAAVVVDENPNVPADPAAAACRYMLVITLAKASASARQGYHNENAHILLLDRRTHATVWDGDTYMAGGASGFEAADVDKFLTGVIAAMHKDGIFDNTAVE